MHMETQALKIIEQVSLDKYTTKEKKSSVQCNKYFIEGNKKDMSHLSTHLFIVVIGWLFVFEGPTYENLTSNPIFSSFPDMCTVTHTPI